MFYIHTYTGTASGDSEGLSTDLLVALGVGMATLAAIILVSCKEMSQQSDSR